MYRTDRSPRRGGGLLVAVNSTLTLEKIYFLNPNDIEFVGVEVSFKSFSIYVTCSYIPPGSDLTIYEQHLSAIKTVLSYLSERDLLIVLGDFNHPDISWSLSTDSLVSTPLSDHDFVDGLLELSLQQVSFIRNSLNRQLDLVFVLDPSEVTVSRIDQLVVPEDQYHPTLELTIWLSCIDTLLSSPLLSPTKSRCFRKCDFSNLINLNSQYYWTNLYNCLDIESATELFYIVLNSFFCECVPDSFFSS